jgi:hypothetical protein
LISAYEIGNEMEGDYSGTIAQLATQTEHFVMAIRDANPSALIVGIGSDDPHASYAFAPGGMFDQWWRAWKAIPANHAHLDAVTFHSYSGGDALAFPGLCNTTTTEFGRTSSSGYVDCVQQALARNGLSGTPIWDTEGSWGREGNHVLTIDQKIAYIGESLLWLWSLGVSRQNWYAWDNQAFGTLCTGGVPCTPTAAATAYQQVYTWMVGSTMKTPCVSNGTVWICGLVDSAGTQTQAVWNTAGSSSYAIPSGYGHYKDLTGRMNTISGRTVTIGIQPILLTP